MLRVPELYQASDLYELLPQRPNELWRMDLACVHIPGHGWWCAVTVIDYYSRYRLACHLTSSYCAAEAIHALELAREEAERIGGPLVKKAFVVTDNGPSFVARRFGAYIKELYSHVRIQRRTPTQLGLLERFHRRLKLDRMLAEQAALRSSRYGSSRFRRNAGQMNADAREEFSRKDRRPDCT